MGCVGRDWGSVEEVWSDAEVVQDKAAAAHVSVPCSVVPSLPPGDSVHDRHLDGDQDDATYGRLVARAHWRNHARVWHPRLTRLSCAAVTVWVVQSTSTCPARVLYPCIWLSRICPVCMAVKGRRIDNPRGNA